MSPLLLGAAWILFVVSCFASMTPAATARPRASTRASTRATRGEDDQPL